MRTFRLPQKAVVLLLTFGLCFTIGACEYKDDLEDYLRRKHDTPSPYSGDIAMAWIRMQIKLTRTTPASPTVIFRRYAYTAVALYESVLPAHPGYRTLAGQLNGLPVLPQPERDARYYWPASANAALAAMNRFFFPTTSDANKAAMDSLEAAFNSLYLQRVSPEVLDRSVTFGQQVAAVVREWSRTDGWDDNTPFTPPVGFGLWEPTPPAFGPPALPNWGKNRLLVAGSLENTDVAPPVAYSEEPGSPYYTMAQDLYELTENITPEQLIIAAYWQDNPDGRSYNVPGHWLSILYQVLMLEKARLDEVAHAYAQMSISMSDAVIGCWRSKYKHFTMRPVTYIRRVLHYPDWDPTVGGTPSHPEFPSGQAYTSAAAAQALTYLFGPYYHFTDHSYDHLGFSPRSYRSFLSAAKEGGDSRVYWGIHYQPTTNLSLELGKTVAVNIHHGLRFRRSHQ